MAQRVAQQEVFAEQVLLDDAGSLASLDLRAGMAEHPEFEGGAKYCSWSITVRAPLRSNGP